MGSISTVAIIYFSYDQGDRQISNQFTLEHAMKRKLPTEGSAKSGGMGRGDEAKKAKFQDVRFTYEDCIAQHVCVAGDFNEWDPTASPLARGAEGRWSATLKLVPGTYEYLFLVDSVWMTDPCAEAVPNPFGSKNSIIRVGESKPQSPMQKMFHPAAGTMRVTG